MVEYARAHRNLEFEIKGLFQQSHYQRNIRLDPQAALRVNLKAYAIMEQADHDPQVLWRICYNLGELYGSVQDYTNSLRYYQQADTLIQRGGTGMAPSSTNAYQAAIYQGIGNGYRHQTDYELARQYFQSALDKLQRSSIKSSQAFLNDDIGSLLQQQHRYAEAIEYRKKAEVIWMELNQSENLSITLGNLALCEAELNHPDAATAYARRVHNLPKAGLDGLKNSYLALYQVESIKQNWQRTLTYYERYIALRDSFGLIFDKQELYKIQSRFDLERIELKNQQARALQTKELERLHQQNEFDKFVAVTQQQRLADKASREKLKQLLAMQQLQERTRQQQARTQAEKNRRERFIQLLKITELNQNQYIENQARNALLVGVGLLLLLGGALLWSNRKLSQRNRELLTKSQLTQDITRKIQTTEITALRAQMNPHFIFNCLNSIQYFTARNDAEKASEYLTKFSRLIRLVLENSRSERVSLANELETLKLYMEMEAMRFHQKVRYQITVEAGIDTDTLEIPPLLLQPFVENAIWHGLMHKEEGGTVQIAVQQPQPNRLRIEIADNGIGRAKAAEYKSKSATKSKSFGMKMTAERIELINQLYQTHTQVVVDDLVDERGCSAGTRVTVDIPI